MSEELPDPDDEEATRALNLYIDSVAADCPCFEPDPRQAQFFSFLDNMRKSQDTTDYQFIPMNGFRASAVDLGWLKDRAEKMVEEKGSQYGSYGLCHLVSQLLDRCVQRPKGGIVTPDAQRGTMEVRFETKDDEGHYEYRFAVPLPAEVWEKHEKTRDDQGK